MAAWILGALTMLRAATIGGPGRALITGAVGSQILDDSFLGDAVIGAGNLLGLGEEKKKRRRRRRALTASDRADIGFIAATLGQPAGKAFALVIASRITG